MRSFSAREIYPTFLSAHESLALQLKWAGIGLWDACKWGVVVRIFASDAEVRANAVKSLLLNSLSLASIYTFDFFLQPLVPDEQRWVQRHIGWVYRVLWILPVVGVSFYLNSAWCTNIAKRTFTLRYGARAAAQPMSVTYTGVLTAIATSAYRSVMVCTSVGVSFALGNIPYVGRGTAFVFLCWVDAYYCFEFLWIARGYSLARRIRHLEERWAYYFAFGLPLAMICSCGTGLANGVLFALVFPVYIMLAMHAHPVPVDPYNPLPALANVHDRGAVRHPSPFVPIRLPVFAPVMWLNDAVMCVLSVVGRPPNRKVGLSAGNGRGRVLSNVAESVEEGAWGTGAEGGGGGERARIPPQKRISIRRRLD